jgi:hypothetical protein
MRIIALLLTGLMLTQPLAAVGEPVLAPMDLQPDYIVQHPPCQPECCVPPSAASDGVVAAMVVATLSMVLIAGIVAWVHTGGKERHHGHSHS